MIQSLPQELLDLIIDAAYASASITPSKSLATVSKAWRPRSQSNMFRNLFLDYHKMRRIRSESPGTSKTTGDVSRHRPIVFSYVRELHIAAFQVTSPEDDGAYLQTLLFFTNVTSLRILDWDFRQFAAHDVTHLLGHFGATVRTLKLHECYVDSEVLIFLTSLFPLTDNLEVDPRYPCRAATYKIQNSDRPSKNVGFRGNLIFKFLSPQHEEFLTFVSEHSSDVRSISAGLCASQGELQRLFERQGSKLSSASVYSLWRQDIVSLSSCIKLRTLYVHLLGDFRHDDLNWDPLFTLASPCLEEVRICFSDSTVEKKFLVGWETIDDLLCQHYDRSYRNGVTNFRVSLHPTDLDLGIECGRLMGFLRKAWPRFMKNGDLILSLEPWDREGIS
jgi:hypothetical protein